MNALPVSNLHRVTATRFWRGTAHHRHVSCLLFRFWQRNWLKVGLETQKCSFHRLCIPALFSTSLCQYCRRGHTQTAGLLQTTRAARVCCILIAGTCWIKIRPNSHVLHLDNSARRQWGQKSQSEQRLHLLGLAFCSYWNTCSPVFAVWSCYSYNIVTTL